MDRTGRRPRIHTPNTIHHVMVRGNNRQNVFYGATYYSHFLEILAKCSEQFDHKIIAYCLMSNHIHLLIHINESPLSLVMKNINHRYARWCNHKQNRIGHLFQGRFRSIEVKDNHYLVNLCRYIHLNPIPAKIVNSIDAYPWSSHHFYVSNHPPQWMSIDFMDTTIKNVTGLKYLDYVTRPREKDAWKPIIYISDTGKVVHDKNIIHQCEGKIETDAIQVMLPSNQVIEIVCKNLNIKKIQALNASRNRQHCKCRAVLAYYLLKYTTMNLSEIGSLYKRSLGTLSRQLAKFNENPDAFIPHQQMLSIENVLDKRVSRLK